MGTQSITQIALILVSVLIIFGYVKPTFENISVLQDEVFQYQDAVAKASQFNGLLGELIATERSFSSSNVRDLDTFLPSTIDEVQVMSDIVTIAQSAAVSVSALAAGPSITPSEAVFHTEDDAVQQSPIAYQDFNFVVEGDYAEVKAFLARMEANAYPLEVVAAGITATESTEEELASVKDKLAISMTVRVSALTP